MRRDEGTPGDVWASGASYEPYVGRWSRLVALDFLTWLSVPPGARWLDVGCGTGALSAAILGQPAPRLVVGVDQSTDYLRYAARRLRATAGNVGASFVVADARALPFASDAFDVVVSGLVLNFIPDPVRALREMARLVPAGGQVAVYVWDYAGRMELMRAFWDAAVALDPGAAALDEGRRFPLCRPGPLADAFRGAGLREVEVRAIDIPTVFRDFDDFWTPFLGGQGPAPGYVMALDEARRAALRERLRSRLPSQSDGSIQLIARAWAVRGRS